MSEIALKPLPRPLAGANTYSPAIALARNYTRWILDSFGPHIGSSILEVGLGHGGYRTLLPQGARYAGLDIDQESIDAAKAANPLDTYLQADILDETLPNRLHPLGIDTVISVNVLEHIAQDEDAVANMASILQPGGKLLLFTPAFPNLFGVMDRLAGHIRRYTLADLSRLFGGLPLRILAARYFNPLGGLAWRLNRDKACDSLADEGLNRRILFFDRVIVPVSKALDPATRSFFGQSLIMIAQKSR